MRTRLGTHVAGLLAAAGFPLTLEDLARLTGRSRAQIAALLPGDSEVAEVAEGSEVAAEAPAPGIRVTADGYAIDDPAAVARVVRGLHHGPLAPGAEHRARVRRLALAPFRAALAAAAESARTEWGWDRAAPFLLGAAYPRSLTAPDERPLLLALLTDPRRQAALRATDPDEAHEQLVAAARRLAVAAETPEDLGALAALLVAASRTRPTGGRPPHGLAPVYAFCGDLERAQRLAERVRVEPDIESAYVGEAAARAGRAEGAEIAAAAAAAVTARSAPAGALLRVAQAVAGTALHTRDAETARELAGSASALIATALAAPEPIPAVAGLTHRVFSGARDHERAAAATTLATTAAAFAHAGDLPAALAGAAEAEELADRIGPDAHRALTLARIAMRLRGAPGQTPRAEPGQVPSAAPGPVAGRAAELAARAVAAGTDAASLAAVARQLAAADAPTAADPDVPPTGDAAQAALAAARALEAISAAADLPPRGALRDIAAALPQVDADGLAVAVVRSVLDRLGGSRHATPLERATRSRHEAIVAAECATILARAGWADEAVAAARRSLELTGRVPASGRARPLAEIAALLLPSPAPGLFDLGVQAADAERRGTAPYWDPDAAELVATAASAAAAAAAGGTEGTDGTERTRGARLAQVRDHAVRALRHHEHTLGLMRLADLSARAGRTGEAAERADAARVSAHTPDPVLRSRAAAALGAASQAGSEALDVPEAARRWLHDGYPISDLPALMSADPRVGSRVTALIAADLAR